TPAAGSQRYGDVDGAHSFVRDNFFVPLEVLPCPARRHLNEVSATEDPIEEVRCRGGAGSRSGTAIRSRTPTTPAARVAPDRGTARARDPCIDRVVRRREAGRRHR